MPAACSGVDVLNRAQQWLFFTASMVLLALLSLGVQLSMQWQAVLLVALMVLVGFPHGALDPVVARRYGLWQSGKGLAGFLMLYLALAAVTLGLWFWFSGLVFSLFLIVSIWHFSNDWRHNLSLIHRLGVALSLIVLPSLFHPAAVQAIYSLLVADEYAAWLVTFAAQLWPLSTLLLMSALLLSLRSDLNTSIEIAVIAATAILLPPLVFFLLYFCLQHSPRHLVAVAKGEKRGHVLVTVSLITALTIVLGAVVYQVLPAQGWQQGLLQTVFVGLITLTVPHMILIEMTYHLQRRSVPV